MVTANKKKKLFRKLDKFQNFVSVFLRKWIYIFTFIYSNNYYLCSSE